MEELKDIFGEESLSFADFVAKVSEKGMKLVNLKAGGYVDKNKFDSLRTEFDKYKTEHAADGEKYADYDALKAEVESLRSEKAENELGATVLAAGVDERFKKFVVSEVKPLVTEEKDFAAALKDYITENAQFLKAKPPENTGTPNPTFTFGSQTGLDGTAPPKVDLDKLSMKDYIAARNKK